MIIDNQYILAILHLSYIVLERPAEAVLELAKSGTHAYSIRLISLQSKSTENREGLIPKKKMVDQINNRQVSITFVKLTNLILDKYSSNS